MQHNSTKSPIRVFIADDNEILADTLRIGISSIPGFQVVGIVLNPNDLLTRLLSGTADVLLLDIFEPISDTLELIKTIKRKDERLKVIVLSDKVNFPFAEETRMVGASYYTVKKLKTAALCNLICEVCNGKTGINFHISGTPRKKIAEQVKNSFTKREMEVLKELCRGAVNNQEIADSLSSQGKKLGPDGIQTHRRNLKAKAFSFGIRTTASLCYWAGKWNYFDDLDI